jgi:pyridoxamine 5'-phosphate oxidase
MNIGDIRLNYKKGVLNESESGTDPFNLLEKWLNNAIEAEVNEPTAMVLSTVSKDGLPDSRVVLLKGFENDRLIFYTNYLSEKGKQIHHNSGVSVLFFWPELERQIRVQGSATKISQERSEQYFNSRPLESRVGAIISPQSQVIDGRDKLEELFKSLLEKCKAQNPAKPIDWGGYEIEVDKIEFWQGRPGRLHDRIRFRKENNIWKRERLAP